MISNLQQIIKYIKYAVFINLQGASPVAVQFSAQNWQTEVTGSIPGRSCRPSHSEFSVVFFEHRVNTGQDPLERPPALHPQAQVPGETIDHRIYNPSQQIYEVSKKSWTFISYSSSCIFQIIILNNSKFILCFIGILS